MTETISANDPNWMAKMGASVFVTVLAPVLVAFGVKMSERVADVTKPAEAAAPAQLPRPRLQPHKLPLSGCPTANPIGLGNAVDQSDGTPGTQVAVVADPAAVAAALAHIDHKPSDAPAKPCHRGTLQRAGIFVVLVHDGRSALDWAAASSVQCLTLDGFYTWFDATEKTRAKDKGKDKDQEKDKDKDSEKEDNTEPMFTVSRWCVARDGQAARRPDHNQAVLELSAFSGIPLGWPFGRAA